MKVKVTKTAGNEFSPQWVGYWAIGDLVIPLKAGSRIVIDRTNRNGVETPGEFVSSKIMDLEYYDKRTVVHTLNSTWEVEELVDADR